MFHHNKKGSLIQRRKGFRKIGWTGACLAFASPIFVLAGPISAAAQADPMPQDGSRSFPVYLAGDELRDGGDPKGWGMARLKLDPKNETACYLVNWTELDGVVTAFHLHAAPRRNNGPHWIDFFNGQHFNGQGHEASGCVHSSQGKILDVINDPSGYYLNIHTSAHKDGAIRGQLF